MAGAEGSSTYPGGKSEGLAGADVLNVRDALFAMFWDIEVREHERDVEEWYPGIPRTTKRRDLAGNLADKNISQVDPVVRVKATERLRKNWLASGFLFVHLAKVPRSPITPVGERTITC